MCNDHYWILRQDDWLDLSYVARTWIVNEAVMGFSLFVIGGTNDDGSIYRTVNDDFTSKLDEAEARIDGSIKFDGCMNVDLHDNHFCGLVEMNNMNECFKRLYLIAWETGITKEKP